MLNTKRIEDCEAYSFVTLADGSEWQLWDTPDHIAETQDVVTMRKKPSNGAWHMARHYRRFPFGTMVTPKPEERLSLVSKTQAPLERLQAKIEEKIEARIEEKTQDAKQERLEHEAARRRQYRLTNGIKPSSSSDDRNALTHNATCYSAWVATQSSLRSYRPNGNAKKTYNEAKAYGEKIKLQTGKPFVIVEETINIRLIEYID